MIYNGRECEIRVDPIGLVGGSFCFAVEIVENGVVIDRHPEAKPLERIRALADENGTTVAQERDNAIQEALSRAEGRFKDIVDVEA